jgi:2-iminobutanoate/2-iminopropanoate deaminase
MNPEEFTMEKVQIITNKAPSPAGPYSQGLVLGEYVFVAGQRPLNPTTNEFGKDIKEQTEFCIKNIEAILEEAGSDLSKIVKSTVYLSDIKDFSAMNEIYSQMIPPPYPVRTTVQAGLRGILVEIEVIAHL